MGEINNKTLANAKILWQFGKEPSHVLNADEEKSFLL